MLSGGAGVSPRAGPSNLGIALPGSNTGRRRGHGPEMKRWTLGSVAGEKQTDGGGGLPVHGDGHQGEDGRRHGDALHRAAQFAHQASEGPPCAQEAPDSCFDTAAKGSRVPDSGLRELTSRSLGFVTLQILAV